jgi:hypothetical protein
MNREAMRMTSHDEKVKRLLDGDIDEAEIAADPILASLAERIFGLSIEPITPIKPSQDTGLPPVEVLTAITSHDSMIEVVPGANPMPLPMPKLPSIPTKVASKKKGSMLKIFSLTSLAVSVANIFGAFGSLNSQCSDTKCTTEATRINWMEVYQITNEMGWSLPYPEIGIPDYVAVGASILLLIVAFLRK